MDLINLFVTILSGQSPLAVIGWVLAAGQAIFITKHVLNNSKLQDRIVEIQEIHTKTVLALQESRIDDLKDLLDQYDKSINALSTAISQKKGGK
jgi:hypothetical protein